MGNTEDMLLDELHQSSGSTITMNSRRLRHLEKILPAEYKIAVQDVEKDIETYVKVDRKTMGSCVRNYVTQSKVTMNVCGACGLRDPEARYYDDQDMKELSWLRIPKEALESLQNKPNMKLVKRGEDGILVNVEIAIEDMYNLYILNGTGYHTIPETVDPTTQLISLCQKCYAYRNCEPIEGYEEDESMYTENAPVNSIAVGSDYGRLSTLRDEGIELPSALERLVLAKERCYSITFKVVALGKETDRQRLSGHTILFPQTPVDIPEKQFGAAMVAAALGSVRIVFVGSTNKRGKLEKSALLIRDLRLRPEVLMNMLTMREKLLPNEPPAPTLDTIKEALKEFNLEHFIQQNARHVVDESTELATQPSDIADVRRAEASTATTDDVVLEPDMQTIGIHELIEQEMATVLQGIQEAVRQELTPEEREARGQPEDVSLNIGRGENPTDDYSHHPTALYNAWFDLFPLQSGLVENQTITESKYRHMFLYHDNRFAQDLPLLFHCADTIMRHNVNCSVGVKIKASPASFDAFKKIVEDADFIELLQTAIANPKGKEAKRVLQRVMSFINIVAGKVPWSGQKRASEVTKFINTQRHCSSGGVFYSFAPDDVHNPVSIRFAHPFTGPHKFPALQSEDFLKALNGQTKAERKQGGMDESFLQRLAAQNPIATTLSFQLTKENVRTNLFAHDRKRKVNKPLNERNKGIFGIPVANRDVIESNQRDAFHAHGQHYGGATPNFIADVVGDKTLHDLMMIALNTHVSAELPVEYHAVHQAQLYLRTLHRRNAACSIPNPPKDTDNTTKWDDWDAKFTHHAHVTVMTKHSHVHMATCCKGKRGATGCRLCNPNGHDIDETRCIQLDLYPKNQTPPRDKVEHRCKTCYANGALSSKELTEDEKRLAVKKEDFLRCIAYTTDIPGHLDTAKSIDNRTLAINLRCRLIPTADDKALANENELVNQIKEAQENNCSLVFPDGTQGDADAYEVFKLLLHKDQKLGKLLSHEDMRTISEELDTLLKHSPDQNTMTTRNKTIRGLLTNWTSKKMWCQNGRITPYSLAMSGCIGANAVPLLIGAGAGGKETTFYVCKYTSKPPSELAAAKTVLVDAAMYIKTYPSAAEDTTSYARAARQFAQRVINKSGMELNASQAASIVLGVSDSDGSETYLYHAGWDYTRLARLMVHTNGKLDGHMFEQEEEYEENSDFDIQSSESDNDLSSEVCKDGDNGDEWSILEDQGMNKENNPSQVNVPQANETSANKNLEVCNQCYHHLFMKNEYMIAVENGSKPEEARKKSKQTDKIKVGDHIVFICGDHFYVVCVLVIDDKHASFYELMSATNFIRYLPNATSIDDAAATYSKFPGCKPDQLVRGVIGFTIGLIDIQPGDLPSNGSCVLRDSDIARVYAQHNYDENQDDIDLLQGLTHHYDDIGHAKLYKGLAGEIICISITYHYAWRDTRLANFSATEFASKFELRKMRSKDKEWFDKHQGLTEDQLRNAQEHESTIGSPCRRYFLRTVHPLYNSHILVVRRKTGILQLTGNPPPRQAKLDTKNIVRATLSSQDKRKCDGFSKYFVANYVPWTPENTPILTWNHWQDFVRKLEEDACLYRAREEDTDALGQRTRRIACGRLFAIENVTEGFIAAKRAGTMTYHHRGRQRDLWTQHPKPDVYKRDHKNKTGAQLIDEIRAKANRLRGKTDLVTRLKYTEHYTNWQRELKASLPSTKYGQPNEQGTKKLQELWYNAATPKHRTVVDQDIEIMNNLNCDPLPAKDKDFTWDNTNIPTESNGSNQTNSSEEHEYIPPEFQPWPSENDYKIAAAAWKLCKETERNGGPKASLPPLNTDQRAAGRAFWRVVQLRVLGRQTGLTAEQIADSITAKDLSNVILVNGAGGTGKSALIHQLEVSMKEANYGFLVITAYTGVAAAPFGGPTLLSLLGLNIQTKFKSHAQPMDQMKREALLQKFFVESGISIENVGGIVIDESSFVETRILGHTDKRFRILLGNLGLVLGGMPLLLCGDNFQKEPPAAISVWYKDMVLNAQERTNIIKHGPYQDDPLSARAKVPHPPHYHLLTLYILTGVRTGYIRIALCAHQDDATRRR